MECIIDWHRKNVGDGERNATFIATVPEQSTLFHQTLYQDLDLSAMRQHCTVLSLHSFRKEPPNALNHYTILAILLGTVGGGIFEKIQ